MQPYVICIHPHKKADMLWSSAKNEVGVRCASAPAINFSTAWQPMRPIEEGLGSLSPGSLRYEVSYPSRLNQSSPRRCVRTCKGPRRPPPRPLGSRRRLQARALRRWGGWRAASHWPRAAEEAAPEVAADGGREEGEREEDILSCLACACLNTHSARVGRSLHTHMRPRGRRRRRR